MRFRLAPRSQFGLQGVARDRAHMGLQGLDPAPLLRVHLLGDENLDGYAELEPDRRNGQGMIAVGGGDDTARGLFARHGKQLVGRAAQLERAGFLLVLEFQEHPRVRGVAEPRRGLQRRLAHERPDSRFRCD